MKQPKLKIISFAICPFVQRAVLLMELKGLEYELEYIDLANKPDWFLALSPMGKVPVLQVDETTLFESQVIVDYLDDISEGSLHPSDPLLKARQRALMELGSTMIMSQWAMAKAQTTEIFNTQQSTLYKQLGFLEEALAATPYFNGDTLSMIDVSFAPLLQRLKLLESRYLADLFQQSPKVAKWAEALLALEAMKRSAHPELEALIVKRIENEKGVLAA
ncbi:glutathione S-transferase family protein [Magnetococcus sp. PR-3]|uniref:glutathione S-transferase family protein n=1 Tax=Magnetococcus sp. PR-3 TaxID=3120355 RepID=UPI002FCE43EF